MGIMAGSEQGATGSTGGRRPTPVSCAGRRSCSDSAVGRAVSRRSEFLLRLCCLGVVLTPLLVGFTLPGAVERLCARGNRLYEKEKYQEAGETYARALKLRPDDPTLHYNQGTALYKASDFEGANRAFAAAMADAPEDLQQDLHYNIGNTRYRMGDFEGAIEQYKQSLRLDSDDGEAKYNLELAQRKLEEQDKDQQKPDDEDEQEDKKNKEEQGEAEEEQADAERREEEQPQQQEQQEAQPEQAEQSQAQEREPVQDEKALTKEQAAALLRALAAEDASLQRIIRRALPKTPREVEKDW